jgi:hypothetical protein
VINCKGCGRKHSWPNFGYYPGICLEELTKATKNLSGSLCQGRHLNPGSPEYEAGVLTTRPRRCSSGLHACAALTVRYRLPLIRGAASQFSVIIQYVYLILYIVIWPKACHYYFITVTIIFLTLLIRYYLYRMICLNYVIQNNIDTLFMYLNRLPKMLTFISNSLS